MRESDTTSTSLPSAGTRGRQRRMPLARARRRSAFPTRLAGSGRVARTSRAAAEVMDGITLRQRRDMILGSPRLPLLRESLHQPRLFAGKIFLLGAIALHVVEF